MRDIGIPFSNHLKSSQPIGDRYHSARLDPPVDLSARESRGPENEINEIRKTLSPNVDVLDPGGDRNKLNTARKCISALIRNMTPSLDIMKLISPFYDRRTPPGLSVSLEISSRTIRSTDTSLILVPTPGRLECS